MSQLKTDILLVGAGAMCATLGSMLKQLNPDYSITMVERLDGIMQESSNGWNNAGTGHAAYCELNYTPQLDDGSVDIHQAFGINARYEVSLQYWSYLVKLGALPSPEHFINPIPHVSVVWGEDNIEFLRKRHEQLIKHPMFSAMEFCDDPEELKTWFPLIMEGRDPNEKVAATRVNHGTDVNFAAVGKGMVDHLLTLEGFDLELSTSVENLQQQANKRWAVTTKNYKTGDINTIDAGFVFVGAGGAALQLLQNAGIKEIEGYAGFPVSGQWLICKNQDVVKRHSVKAYGKAPVNAPPMSVPHLDYRIINGEKSLLFGPFAGFTTKFLVNGSIWDMFTSIKLHNLWPIIKTGLDNLPLVKYLITEILQTQKSRVQALKQFYPNVNGDDWVLAKAGQRVQVIKKCPINGGKIEFGTETIHTADGTLAGLLGESPGASLLVPIILEIIEECFTDELSTEEWHDKVRKIIPSYGISIVSNKELFMSIREDTISTLKLNIHH